MIPERQREESVELRLKRNNGQMNEKLVSIFTNPTEEQLFMTSILGRGEISTMAEAKTVGRLLDDSRYIYDENDNLIKHISLIDVHIEYLLRFKMSQNGKNREYLTWLTEGEQYANSDDDINELRKL